MNEEKLTKNFSSVIAAKKAAEGQLSFYREMMRRKVMNERILELAKQAGLKKEHVSDREYIGDFDWRLFAKLIVEDSAMVIDKHYEPVYDGALLKRHFGIE